MSAIRESIESTIKKIKLKKRKCRFARCSKVSFDCKFEGNNFIDRYAKIVSSSFGYATYVGHNSSIECRKIYVYWAKCANYSRKSSGS